MRVPALILAALVVTTSAVRADDRSLRHVEYDVATQVDGTRAHQHLVLDLVAARGESGSVVDVTEPDSADPVRVILDRAGVARTDGDLSPEAALLCYFFSLGAQNLSGMGRGDSWNADGTRFRVLRAAGTRLEMSFARDAYVGRLIYDASKVIPVSFETRGNVNAEGIAHDVRYVVTLTDDSQP